MAARGWVSGTVGQMALQFAANPDPAPEVATTGAPRSAFARCVAVDPAKFAADDWGASRCCRGRPICPLPDGFTDLLSPADADELLSRRGLRTPFLRVAKDGRVAAAARFTGSGGAGAEIGDQVRRRAGPGALRRRRHAGVPGPAPDSGRRSSTSPASWARRWRQPLQINAYLTPAGNQGFATHYDTHDVFVLQVDGRKHWRIHPPVLPRPAGEPAVGWPRRRGRRPADGHPALDVVLAPGDALYLPRGWLHSAQAQGQARCT